MRSLLPLLLFLAGPALADAGCQPDVEASIAALNALRAEARSCGGRLWPAAPALRWQADIGESAQRLAQVLARRDRLEHDGEGGGSLRLRLGKAGYAARAVGENLAGGPWTLDEALAQWAASPTHCENLMAAEFLDVGLACATGPGQLQRYWVLQLAEPELSPFRSSPGR
jgi:uncharacterized protein YkwD